jgi:hypothetical protein
LCRCRAGAKMQMCRGVEVQKLHVAQSRCRCRGAEVQSAEVSRGGAEVQVQRWCRGGAEQVQRCTRCRGAPGCRGAQGGAEVEV